MNRGLRALREQSLVKGVSVTEKGCIEVWRVHRLLQEVIREETHKEWGKQESLWQAFLTQSNAAVSAVFPEAIHTTEDALTMVQCVAHGHAFLNYMETIAKTWPAEMSKRCLLPCRASLLAQVGDGEFSLASYDIAQNNLHTALADYRIIYGQTSSHSEIATILMNLGNVYNSQGDYPRAIDYYESSLTMNRALYGQTSNHPKIATILMNLGNVYYSQEDYPRAIEYYESSLTMKRAIYGRTLNHPDIASALMNLGNVYCSQRNYPRGIEYYELSLTMKRAIYGRTLNHPDIAMTLMNLGSAYYSQRNYPRAIEYYELSLTMNRAIYGQTSNHPDILKVQNNLRKADTALVCSACCSVVCCCPCVVVAHLLKYCGFFEAPQLTSNMNSVIQTNTGEPLSLNTPLMSRD